MSFYENLKKNDVVEWVRPLLDQKVYKIRCSDGRFGMCEMSSPYNSPWHHIEHQPGAKCPYLHQQLFNVISPRTPAGKFIPRFCQSCWKIVIRPQNLDQLFVLEDLLTHLGWPSKCGIERRPYTPLSKSLYGGYIYSNSRDQGLKRLIKIREHISDIPELADVVCYLKRACTEMEMAFPDSDSWTVTDEQNRVEDILDWMIVYDLEAPVTPSHLVSKVHMGWVEWAAQHGDETYLKYTGGKRLYPDCVRYEPKVSEDTDIKKVEGADEATPDDETVSVGESSPAVPKGNTRKKTKGKKK